MNIRNWLKAQQKRPIKSRRRSTAGQRYRSRPILERLEDRIQPTTIFVTTNGDGPGMQTQDNNRPFDLANTTLRGAIEMANSNAINTDPGTDVTIAFDTDFFSGGNNNTILLRNDLPPLTITRDRLVIDGANPFEIITLDGSSSTLR